MPVNLLPYPSPGDLCDDAGKQVWDIGNVGSVPQRAAEIDFSAPYCEIHCTYIVSAGKFRVGVRVTVTVMVMVTVFSKKRQVFTFASKCRLFNCIDS